MAGKKAAAEPENAASAQRDEDLAARHPERRDEYRRAAEQARNMAREARQILRTFTD
jgi:hypothetical protein